LIEAPHARCPTGIEKPTHLQVLSFECSGQLVHAYTLLPHGHIECRFDRNVHWHGNTHLAALQRARRGDVIAICDAGTDGFRKAVCGHCDGVVAIFALSDCIRQIRKRYCVTSIGFTLKTCRICKIHILSP